MCCALELTFHHECDKKRKRARKRDAEGEQSADVMLSSSPKTPKNFLRKVKQTFHGSLSSLTDLPDSSYHRENSDHPSDTEHTVSLQNLPQFNPSNSPKFKLKKKQKDGISLLELLIDL